VWVLSSRPSLAWRVFLTNSAVLVCVFAVLVLSPATISAPVVVSELIVLFAAITITLFVNMLLLERVFAPLDALRRLMRRVDPLQPGQRVSLQHADADVAALADAFNAMLDRLETERRESAQRSLAAQEEERVRVARELHDELGQLLTGALLLIDEAAKSSDGRAHEDFVEAREATRQSIEAVRRIVTDLRPEALDDLGLTAALVALTRSFSHQTDIEVQRRMPAELPRLSPEQELVVYRIAQEALTNVARHARARHAKLALEQVDGELLLTVRDDGEGFGGSPTVESGIRGMRERALLVRGMLSVQSTRGVGTDVCLKLPLDGP